MRPFKTRSMVAPVALALVLGAVTAGAQEPVHWEHVGWGGGGFFWSCAYHPTDPDVMYLGGDVGGVYKTEDQGLHWRFANQGLHNYGVYGMAIAMSRPDTLYVQTLDGLARTEDGGAHWERLAETGRAGLNLSAGRGVTVRPIAIDPVNPDVVYAGGATGKLGKTEDGGKTWRRLPYLETASPRSAAAETEAFTGTGFLVLTYDSDAGDYNSNGRVEKGLSYPAGADWSAWSKLTARFYVPEGAPRIEGQLVVQTGDDWLWQQSQFVSGQPGAWTEVALDLSKLKGLAKTRQVYFVVRSPEQGYHGEVFLDTLALHTRADTRVDAGAIELPEGVTLQGDWETASNTDGWRANTSISNAKFVTGARQSAQAGTEEKGAITSVVVADSDPRLVFAASTTYGLLRSQDAGATWTRLKAPDGVVSLSIPPQEPDVLYAACGKSGVHLSRDQGDTWEPLNTGFGADDILREVAVNPLQPGLLYAIASRGWDGVFYRSEDGGRNWKGTRHMTRSLLGNPTLPDETGGGAYPRDQATLSRPTNIAVSPVEPDLLFLSGNWRNAFSADGGRTWSERSNGADITCVQDIQFAGDRTYVVAMDEGMVASADNGATWQAVAPLKYSEALSGHQWRVRVIKQDTAERIVATLSPWSGQPNAVLLSNDGGRSFEATTAGLPSYVPKANTMWGQGYARALATDPGNPDVLYLGIDGDPEPDKGLAGGGVFKSSDGGVTWTQLANQPGSRRGFFGLVVDPTDSRRLFWGASGSGGGVWRSEDAGGTWEHVFRNESWVFNVAISPRGVVYAGSNNLWRSDDHGKTWKPVSQFSSDGGVVVGIEIDPSDEQRLWLSRVTWGEGVSGGIFRTMDGGGSWQEITGDIGYRKPLVLRYNPVTRELWAGGVGLFKTPQ